MKKRKRDGREGRSIEQRAKEQARLPGVRKGARRICAELESRAAAATIKYRLSCLLPLPPSLHPHPPSPPLYPHSTPTLPPQKKKSLSLTFCLCKEPSRKETPPPPPVHRDVDDAVPKQNLTEMRSHRVTRSKALLVGSSVTTVTTAPFKLVHLQAYQKVEQDDAQRRED